MMGGWWVVSAKIKDQQGPMKDRVRERIMSVKLDKGKKRNEERVR